MIEKLNQKLNNGVKENEILAGHVSFKIGGPARYFYSAQNNDDLIASVKVADELNIPYFILGWGSNLLVSDAGFDGLVIKTNSNEYKITGENIFVQAGFSLNRLVGIATQAGLSGLENFAGIPGTVGGAARGNAGAFGIGFGDKIIELEIYRNGKIEKVDRDKMEYAYRSSILKDRPGVILSVVMKLQPGTKNDIQQKVIDVIKARKNVPFEPSAGCIFKNCELSQLDIDQDRIIKSLDITLPEWQEVTRHGKLPVGYIIDKLGLKEKTIGGAQISPKHCAFIINVGHARAEHVMMLISDIKMRVRNQLGIQLQEEVQYLGF